MLFAALGDVSMAWSSAKEVPAQWHMQNEVRHWEFHIWQLFVAPATQGDFKCKAAI